MVEERFQNFISTSFPDTDSESFLAENRKRLRTIKTNPEHIREFKYYKALSNELRFHIYKLLEILPLCTCALARIFDKKENIVNHHLKVLEKEGLIEGQKQSYFTVYRPVYKK